MHDRLAGLLAGLRGQFLLSLNDVPGVREVFRRFAIESVPVSYSVGLRPEARRPAGEVLISRL